MLIFQTVPPTLLALASLIAALRARHEAREARESARDAHRKAADAAREQINFALRRAAREATIQKYTPLGEGG